jgi:hypothetical protein
MHAIDTYLAQAHAGRWRSPSAVDRDRPDYSFCQANPSGSDQADYAHACQPASCQGPGSVRLLPAAERDVRLPHRDGSDGVSSARDSKRRCPTTCATRAPFPPRRFWVLHCARCPDCLSSRLTNGVRKAFLNCVDYASLNCGGCVVVIPKTFTLTFF